MRTQEQWEKYLLPKALSQLSPRLRHDVETLPFPKKMPSYGSYFIHGPAEVGKTVLAARMWIEAKKRFYFESLPGQALFISVPEFFLEIKKTYGHSQLEEQVVLAKYAEAEFLVLDDLGSEQATEWMRTMLYLLINRRYENIRTTVITSNYSLEELDDKLGDTRIPARIKRMCKAINPKR